MKLYRQLFEVEGRHPFPIDMLRYDACFPASETESHKINATFDGGRIETTRVTLARYIRADMKQEPTSGRWHSFGWTVIWNSTRQSPI